jgi:hypothetical protein
MSQTLNFAYQAASGGAYAIRVIGLTGSQAGQVLDFAGTPAFKSIGSATTPYSDATELTGIAGTGQSIYVASLNLASVNASVVFQEYQVAWCPGSAPGTTVNPVKLETVFSAQNGNLGPRAFNAMAELSVKSTVGDAAQLSLWLEDGSVLVPIGALDSGASGQIVVRQFLSGTNFFTQSLVSANLINNVFEVEYSPTPGTAIFQDDRQYDLTCSVTCNGVTFTGETRRVVIGGP